MFGENYIQVESAKHLAGLFRERVNLTPNVAAFKEFDEAGQQWQSTTWHEMSRSVVLWQQVMLDLGLKQGDHVAIMASNSRNWVRFDQAALGLGLITVPLYVEDRADNVAYIINNAEVKVLFVDGEEQWQELINVQDDMPALKNIVSIQDVDAVKAKIPLLSLSTLLEVADANAQLVTANIDTDSIASIVYTSGTTGRPKGVMLSHKNILSNAWSGLQCASIREDSVFLSFLPLSHMLERSVGYYMPMMAGSCVAYTRGIPILGEDLQVIKPHVLISVPRIYEKVYAKIQAGLEEKSAIARFLFHKAVDIGWQRFEYRQARRSWFPGLFIWPLLNALVARKIMARLGGRMEVAISGGAPLPPEIAKIFIALGLPLLQGYGLTESSPVLTVNREAANIPHSIGQALPGVTLRIAEGNELQAKGDNIMLGYWKNEEATKNTFTDDGWLKTGDCASVDELGHYYITGRLKDILVLGNGEKVPPADMEMAIALEPLFENVMVVGEGRSHLTAIVTLDDDEWRKYLAKHNLNSEDAIKSEKLAEYVKTRVSQQLESFPGYAVIREVLILNEHWTVDNGLVTPTMKVKRPKVLERYQQEVDAMYERILNRHKS